MEVGPNGLPDAASASPRGTRVRWRRAHRGKGAPRRHVLASPELAAYRAVAGLMRAAAEEGPWPWVGAPQARGRRRRPVALVP